jgi:pimeloyl-ACP methyl ester carboxylesterase
MAHHTGEITPFSDNPDFDFEIRNLLGQAAGGSADPGEVLAATAGIAKHDHVGWFRAWHELGQRTAEAAQASAKAGHRVSAARGFLRASAYFGVAVNAVSSLKDSAELIPTFREQREAWESFITNTPMNVQRLDIPYENSSMPAWLLRATQAPAGAPTIVLVNGSDGSLAALWGATGAAALERGYNVLLFDGPGQQSQLFERGVPFRPDWEYVLTPVFDFVAGLDGIDPDRIAVYGVSQGGYWVARALAFEHRFVAAITDPGVVDVSASWTSQLPKSMNKLLDDGQNAKFDKEMTFGMKFSPETERTWQFRARPYGTSGFAETIQAVRGYNMTDVASKITTPLLITSPEGEQFWPGQAEQLATLTASVSTIIHFTANEGAGEHCQPLARTVTAQRIFDWLDDHTAVPRKS